MVVKPSIGFLSVSTDALLVTGTQTIVNSLTNNPDYPTPTPTLVTVTAALNAFMVAIADAAAGGKEQTAIKIAKRAELVSLLRQLASYVGVTCGGDMAKLLSSGFPTQKPNRTPIGVLPAPNTPVVAPGALSGQLDAVSAPVFGAYTYNWRLALASAPTVYVQQLQTTAARNTFSGLTPGQIYRIQLNAVGSAGPSDWSDDGESMVL
jgi:hypothetical protein